jgi:hypothetical protein
MPGYVLSLTASQAEVIQFLADCRAINLHSCEVAVDFKALEADALIIRHWLLPPLASGWSLQELADNLLHLRDEVTHQPHTKESLLRERAYVDHMWQLLRLLHDRAKLTPAAKIAKPVTFSELLVHYTNQN